jgi:hypothetical protein
MHTLECYTSYSSDSTGEEKRGDNREKRDET